MKKIASILLLTLCSCTGGGGGGGGSSPQPTSGVFLDSAVGGVYYRSDSKSGMTDDQGKYECVGSENVEFYLKGDNGKEVTLGSSSCRGTTSPIDLVTQGSLNYQTSFVDLSEDQSVRVIGMLRLLQSMDTDQNPSNGITIAAADVSILADELEEVATLNVALNSMFSSSEGYDTKLSSMISLMGKTLVSESSAVAHFNESRQEETTLPCETEGCGGEPSGPPVVIPPTVSQTECYQGVTYGSSSFGSGGISYGTNYPIDVNTGSLKANAGFNEKIYTLIVIPPTGNADFYRWKNNAGAFYKFPVVMTVIEASGVVQLRGVGFTDGMQTLTLGARVDMGGIMTRTGTEMTFGSFVSSFDRMFRKVDCYPPAVFTSVVNTQ
mgnify:CR=1 FL=1